MADNDYIEPIRISELETATSIDTSADFLVVAHPSDLYTSGYETFKATPQQLVSSTAPEASAISYNNTTSGLSANNVQSAIDEVVNDINTLPDPMVFKGSLGTGGTISQLPTDGSSNIGDTYKVITDGTYAGQSAKIGDTFICDSKTEDSNTWSHIPSGDEPSGTVTSVTIQATSPIAIDSSAAITTSGTRTISHAASGVVAGSYGDSTAQTPAFGGSINVPYITVDATGHVTAASNTSVTIPASNLSEAQGGTDVTLVTTGDKYNWNHTTGGASSLDDLTDVTLTTPSNGQVLKYDGSKWVNGSGGGGGASALDDLTDVNITSASAGQTLVYTSNGEWVNDTPPSGVTTLGALSDVSVASATNGQFLKYDTSGSTPVWTSGGESLDDLTNVNITGLQDGEVLVYDNATSKWINGTGGGGASTLSQLNDVDITAPSNGQVLSYNYSSSEWVNDTLSINSLSDVSVSSPSADQVLKYSNGAWVNATVPAGATALSALTDVNVAGVTDGQFLKYDSSSSKWIPGSGGGGGSAQQTAVTQAQYDALVQAGTVDPTMEYFITDGIPSSVEYYHNYSTTEHIVGKWIDNSIIYEKTYTTDFVQGSTYVDIDVSNENINTVFSCEGILKASPEESIQQMVAIPYGATNLVYINIISTHDGYVRITRQQGHFYGYTPTIWITIRYSKSST